MEEAKPHINIVTLGHVDSGKSTTIGHLLLLSGRIDPREFQRIENLSDDLARGSFKYAWILDRLKAERERGISIIHSFNNMKTDKYDITFIDSPGHKDFLKNMITGTSQADAGILLCSASEGEFEAGCSSTGQTRDHAILAYTMGIRQLIIVINKMDSCGYSEERFYEIKEALSTFLTQTGYKEENLNWVACSGYKGVNIINRYNDNDDQRGNPMTWYHGDTLKEAIDKLNPPKRLIDKPLRIPLDDVWKISGVGTVPLGTVKTGILKPGIKIYFAPAGLISECKSIESHHVALSEAIPGDYVGFNVKGIPVFDIKKGDVAGDVEHDPPKRVVDFKAEIIIINHPHSIKEGYCPIIDCHTARTPAKFTKFVKKVDRNGNELDTNPKELKNGDIAIVLISPLKPFVCETFAQYPPLGRFTIRDSNKIVGVGVVKEISKEAGNRH